MRTILVYKGLPGCGKSTEAKKLLKKEPGRWKRFNRDDLRNMIDDGDYSKDNEEFVVNVQELLVRRALQDGYDVILDNTHLVTPTVKKIHKLAESVGDVQVIEKGINESIQVCIERNAKREGRAKVPEDVIHRMAKGAGIDRGRKLEDKVEYYPPRTGGSTADAYVTDESLPQAILCDLDGTLAKIGDRSPYDASECDVKDLPNWPVIHCVLAMHARGVNIIFMSGRDSAHRDPTIRFIEQWCKQTKFAPGAVGMSMSVIPYQLHMRGHGDQRKDSIVKQELFDEHIRDKYNVLFVLDDRNQVVDFGRSIGLTCFQVDYGDF